jgi:maltooligosyltrehalose trehalohydrolase
VLLDVVYNHFGPSGNYLAAYSPAYFSENVHNAWGQSPNFKEPALRRLVLDNARYWLREFSFDGLRLDATHAIVDGGSPHILHELVQLAHGLSPAQLLVAEDERNHAELVARSGLDAIWADDFHHQLRVTLTKERFAYYAAYEPSAQGVADVINRGWLYVGQPSPLTGAPRGTPADALPAEAFVYCIQNHDQIGNRAFGDRTTAHLSHSAFRGASLLLLFLPMTPLLFMGQEWAASTPFLYFTDHHEELGQAIREGRRREFAGTPGFADETSRARIPDPQASSTFHSSKLLWSERELPEHRSTLELYRAALKLRQTDAVLLGSGRAQLLAEASGNVLMVHRWRGNERRVLIMNLGEEEVALASLAEHLRLHGARAVLRSSFDEKNTLAFGDAVVLAGEGNLAGLVEGAA